MIGYDPSSFYLEIAKNSSRKRMSHHKLKLRFIRGDPYKPTDVLLANNEMNFDAIIVMDNSFGYLGEPEDILMLRELREVAGKNCLLLLETENRDWRILNFEAITSFESQKVNIYAMWKFNFETSVSHGISRFYDRVNNGGQNLQLALELNIHMRLYSLHELRALLRRTGWNYKESYDDIASLQPFSNGNLSIFSASFAG